MPIEADEQLGRIILKACAFEPKDRWQSPEDMYNALADLGEGTIKRRTNSLPPAPPPVIPPQPDPPEPRKNKQILLLVIAALLVTLIGYAIIRTASGLPLWPFTPVPTATPAPTTSPTPTSASTPSPTPTPTSEPTQQPTAEKDVGGILQGPTLTPTLTPVPVSENPSSSPAPEISFQYIDETEIYAMDLFFDIRQVIIEPDGTISITFTGNNKGSQNVYQFRLYACDDIKYNPVSVTVPSQPDVQMETIVTDSEGLMHNITARTKSGEAEIAKDATVVFRITPKEIDSLYGSTCDFSFRLELFCGDEMNGDFVDQPSFVVTIHFPNKALPSPTSTPAPTSSINKTNLSVSEFSDQADSLIEQARLWDENNKPETLESFPFLPFFLLDLNITESTPTLDTYNDSCIFRVPFKFSKIYKLFSSDTTMNISGYGTYPTSKTSHNRISFGEKIYERNNDAFGFTLPKGITINQIDEFVVEFSWNTEKEDQWDAYLSIHYELDNGVFTDKTFSFIASSNNSNTSITWYSYSGNVRIEIFDSSLTILSYSLETNQLISISQY